MKLVAAVAAIALLGYLFSALKSKRELQKGIDKTLHYGPFTIYINVSTSKGYNINFKSVTHTNVAYRVTYQGKPIPFPGALQNNTGLPYMWNVFALTGAPDPTLIAGSQSLYLIYLKDNIPVVEPLLQQGHDFASLQFLDAENGQPGAFQEVFAKSDTSSLDQLDTLQGGRFLMVGEHAVLDVQTRKIWPFHAGNEGLDNYSFPSPHGALALSPDQKSIVFRAEFQSWNAVDEDLPDSEHALVVYDFELDKGYTVKFDDTDTRLTNVQNADHTWFEQYFEWTKTQEGVRLQLRKLDKLPNWQGKFDPKDGYYTLYPVRPGMLPVFLGFVLQQMGWTPANIVKDTYHEYTGRCLDLASGETKLDIRFKEDEQTLSFSKHLYTDRTPANQETVKKIAVSFNAELSSGKHQEHFGRIRSATKEIRGLYKKN